MPRGGVNRQSATQIHFKNLSVTDEPGNSGQEPGNSGFWVPVYPEFLSRNSENEIVVSKLLESVHEK